jgi:glycogen debranching enzyme
MDSVFHSDGTLAEGPIALCEMQAYVYGAKRGGSELASILGHNRKSEDLFRQAWRLQSQFEKMFWDDTLGTYVLALDGNKRPCQVRTSNAGQCLYTGIASQDHARSTYHALVSQDIFSGWGIRTLSELEVRYNPMSYHNGSIWPHDNAMIAQGFSRYGFKQGVLKILKGLFESSLYFDLHRMPELFCGFPKRLHEGPTLYPVACNPQSWASAAVFMLLQAALGLKISGTAAEVTFSHPVLPDFIRELVIRNLRVGEGSVDVVIQRHDEDVGVNVLRRRGKVNVLVIK